MSKTEQTSDKHEQIKAITLDDYPGASRATSQGELSDYKKTKGLKPRKLFSKKANGNKIIVETLINQVKAELIGTFSLTDDGKWIFMDLVFSENGILVCTCPKNAIEVKQVGVAF
jgi:hypothetical protein